MDNYRDYDSFLSEINTEIPWDKCFSIKMYLKHLLSCVS